MRFALGRTVMTQGVESLVTRGVVNPGVLLSRHVSGDWGDCDREDRMVNERAVKDGSRILSVYGDVWCLTEADRSVTTLLLASEY